jgi:hypothetical protein
MPLRLSMYMARICCWASLDSTIFSWGSSRAQEKCAALHRLIMKGRAMKVMIAFAMIVTRVEQLLSFLTGRWCSGDNENKKRKKRRY